MLRDGKKPKRMKKSEQWEEATHAMKTDFRWQLDKDGKYLAWIFKQFLAGEMTGLLEGKALLKAPTLNDADFLASQIRDEIRHAKIYQRMLQQFSASEYKVPFLLTKLVAPLSGRLWQEHCFIDKAVGEHWVLCTMAMLYETTEDSRIKKTLATIASDELRHIEFGESKLKEALAIPFYKKYLLGLYYSNRLMISIFSFLVRQFFLIKKRNDLAAMTEIFFAKAVFILNKKLSFLFSVSINTHYPLRIWTLMIASRFFFLVRKLTFRRFYRGPQLN